MGRPNGMLNPAAGVPSYGGAPNRIHSSQEFRQRGFNARSSYDLNRGQTYATRHQLTRGLIGTPAVRDTGVLASYQAILSSRNQFRTPIERLHSRANLLQPKSPLGQIVTIPELAIYDAAVVKPSDPIAPQADSISVMPEEEGASLRDFDNAMAERLRRRYDEYSVQGLAYFKQKNYIRARDCFDICRGLDRKNPWPYAMDTFVAMETQEFSRAANSLVGAVTRARSLEDLKLDVKLIYGDELDFEKTLNSASNLASADAKDETGKRIKAGQLLLAYCAWHNNDLPTAVSAAQAAARSFPGDAGEGAQRFADLLKAEASGKKSDPEQDETPK